MKPSQDISMYGLCIFYIIKAIKNTYRHLFSMQILLVNGSPAAYLQAKCYIFLLNFQLSNSPC